MSTPGTAAEAWAVLTAPEQTAYALYPLGEEDQPLAHAGVDRQGRRFLIVPCPSTPAGLPGPFPVLTVAVEAVAIGGRGTRVLLLRCEDPAFWREFTALCDDVLDALPDSDDPAGATLAVLERWRRLLAVGRVDSLRMHQRMGLFAELTLLRSLLLRGPDLGAAVWTGPDRAPHDFTLPSGGIEVKAVGTGSDSVTVHGLHQLKPVDGTRLLLAVAVVSEDPAGSSIGEIIGEIEHLAGGGEVREQAERVGWTDRDVDQRFAVLEWVVVDVDDDTPRLVPAALVAGGLPDGVHSLTYAVDLHALRSRSIASSTSEIAAEVLR